MRRADVKFYVVPPPSHSYEPAMRRALQSGIRLTPKSIDAATTAAAAEEHDPPRSPRRQRSGPSRVRFLDLPTEIRLLVYDYALSDAEVHATPGAVRWKGAPAPYWSTVLHGARTQLATVPWTALPGIVRANAQICRETLPLCHSRVRYVFPTVIALLDVLSGWSPRKIRTVRHVRVTNSGVAIDVPVGSWWREVLLPWTTAHLTQQMWPTFARLLTLFEGLALDSLEVQDPGPDDGRRRSAGTTRDRALEELARLVYAPGWRALHFAGLLHHCRDLDYYLAKQRQSEDLDALNRAWQDVTIRWTEHIKFSTCVLDSCYCHSWTVNRAQVLDNLPGDLPGGLLQYRPSSWQCRRDAGPDPDHVRFRCWDGVAVERSARSSVPEGAPYVFGGPREVKLDAMSWRQLRRRDQVLHGEVRSFFMEAK